MPPSSNSCTGFQKNRGIDRKQNCEKIGSRRDAVRPIARRSLAFHLSEKPFQEQAPGTVLQDRRSVENMEAGTYQGALRERRDQPPARKVVLDQRKRSDRSAEAVDRGLKRQEEMIEIGPRDCLSYGG